MQALLLDPLNTGKMAFVLPLLGPKDLSDGSAYI
jgi:hypothetical protein